MAPANTGRDSNSKMAVIRTLHTNKGIFSSERERDRIFTIVEIKFTAPRIEETPAKCREKIVKSTAAPL